MRRPEFPGYLAFTDPLTLTRILAANGGFDARHLGRVLVLYAVSPLILPLAALETLLFGRRVAAQPLDPRPLIVLGHDRSGTTHLLNLLSLDPRFAWIRPSQMVFPRACLLLDRLVDRFLERIDYRRPFDAMPVGPGSPQDDEVPLVKLGPHCEYHKYSFPRSHRRWLERYVFAFGPGSPEHAAWRRTYVAMLRKAALLMGRDRLLLKSPATMANLEAVLALFPDARFVHIARDPRRVLPSQLHLHRTMIDKYALETVSDEQLRDLAFTQYRGYMEGYLRDRHRIPAGHLVEVRYEDLVTDRVAGLRAIYDRLELGGFDAVEGPLRAHLASIEGYRGHRFSPDPALEARIERELGFALDALGYPRRPPAGPGRPGVPAPAAPAQSRPSASRAMPAKSSSTSGGVASPAKSRYRVRTLT